MNSAEDCVCVVCVCAPARSVGAFFLVAASGCLLMWSFAFLIVHMQHLCLCVCVCTFVCRCVSECVSEEQQDSVAR